MKIAVTDGNTRAALAITRSLGKSRHWVAVGDQNNRSLAGASKYCADAFSYPPPEADVALAMEELANQLKPRKIELLIPVADKSLLSITEFKDKFFGEIQIPVPDLDTVCRASDKFALFELAQSCGVPIPKTIFVKQPVRDVGLLAEDLRLPVIIKPARSVFRHGKGLLTAGINYAHSIPEIRSLVETKQYLRHYPFLIQERIIGPGVGYFVLLVEGNPVAEFAHRRIREKPPSGGVSVYSESTFVSSDIRDYSLRLLRALGWSGVAMVEFKIDQDTGTPMLMEINGRFWGSLQLAIDSGCDFPNLLVNSINNGVSRPQTTEWCENYRWRWLLGDFDNLLLRCFKPEKELALPPGYPSRARSLLQFLSSTLRTNLSYDVLKLDDLRPFFRELRYYVEDLLW